MGQQWVLLWLFLSYSENIEHRLPFAAVKEIVLPSYSACMEARANRLPENDTLYMISHGDAKLVCVQIPPRQELYDNLK